MKAILLCAGYATRLYPLTKDKPKPLLTVDDKPIAEYIIEKLSAFEELSEVYVVTNNKFYQTFCDWSEGYDSKIPIKIINDKTMSDDDKLGAIGDLGLVVREKNIQEETIVVAGDNLFDFELDGFLRFFNEKKPEVLVGSYDVQDKELATQYGILKLNEDFQIESFLEKPQDPPSTFASMAIYFFSKEGITMINDYLDQGLNPDQPGHYIRWLAENHRAYGYVFKGNWFDIGDIESYQKADAFYKENSPQN